MRKRLAVFFLVVLCCAVAPALANEGLRAVDGPLDGREARAVQSADGSEAASAPESFAEQHSDKAYVFLLVEDEVKVNADWSFTRHVRRKVLVQKEEARDMGEIPVRYDRDYDRILEQKIFTVTPEGKRLPPIKTQDMAVYRGEPMYSNAMVRVLSRLRELAQPA